MPRMGSAHRVAYRGNRAPRRPRGSGPAPPTPLAHLLPGTTWSGEIFNREPDKCAGWDFVPLDALRHFARGVPTPSAAGRSAMSPTRQCRLSPHRDDPVG